MTTEAPKRRGPAPGTKTKREHMKVCPAPECPHEGQPVPMRANQTYCSKPCKQRAFTAGQHKHTWVCKDCGAERGAI